MIFGKKNSQTNQCNFHVFFKHFCFVFIEIIGITYEYVANDDFYTFLYIRLS